MEKKCIVPEGGPPVVGPYSPACAAGNLLFVSGQLSLNPDGSGPKRGTIQEETTQALENLKAILAAAGTRLDRVVKCTVFLQDLANFAAFNEVYKTYFPENPPARTTFQVAKLPLDMQVEVEAIAIIP